MNNLDFSARRFLIVGDVMLDSYLHGSTSRISPEAPVAVVHVEQEEARVGGAGNVALNAAALGARSGLLGLVGQDATADQLEDLLTTRGVRCCLQRVAGSQ
ncbi:MAG: PfkB family carbohydrate kinase [Spirochaetota bacterium]